MTLYTCSSMNAVTMYGVGMCHGIRLMFVSLALISHLVQTPRADQHPVSVCVQVVRQTACAAMSEGFGYTTVKRV